MKSIASSPPVEITTESKPDGREVEAVPAKKRGTFLPSRFFGHNDHEANPLPDDQRAGSRPEKNPLDPTTDIPQFAVAPDLPESRLAVRTSPAGEDLPAVTPTSESLPTMISNDPAQPPDHRRSTAQLTFGFEIASLQLTPSFKLGAIQLRALSNVVSLHLVAAGEQENPLAAAVAFQIERVELDGAAGWKSLLLKPLGEPREVAAPQPKLHVGHVALSGGDAAPISVITSEQLSTTVQLFGTFTIATIDFTPGFEIDSLRLEPASKIVFVRVAASSLPVARDLPPAFAIAEVHTGDNAQIVGARLIPSAPEDV